MYNTFPFVISNVFRNSVEVKKKRRRRRRKKTPEELQLLNLTFRLVLNNFTKEVEHSLTAATEVQSTLRINMFLNA